MSSNFSSGEYAKRAASAFLSSQDSEAWLSVQEAAAAVTESLCAGICRRMMDIMVAASVLVLFSPVMLLCAIVIRRDSPGPALFVQTRMTRCRRTAQRDRRRRPDAPAPAFGERRRGDRRAVDLCGRPFRFVKFRTMYRDARERFSELYRYEYGDEEIQTMKFKLEHDPRTTRFGSWLRRTSLDELPNFWNVLRGDMTLVGPRPEIPEMSPYYDRTARYKFRVPAGVTGLAQVNGRGHLTFRQTIRLDVQYVVERSLARDLALLWRTAKAVVTRNGAH